MNQKTLQNIYRSFQTEEFYRRYFGELGCREDRRTMNQQRPIKITSKNNSVVLSCGQTIIIAHLQTNIQQVTFSPVTMSFGQPLLKVKASSGSSNAKQRQTRVNKHIEEYISQKIDWKVIEDQLSNTDLLSGKQYAYKGQILLKILGDDGGIQEYGLLAIQILLWTSKFKRFTINKEKTEYGQEYKLQLNSFIYPLKYAQIMDKILIDPSSNEQQHSNILVTVLKDLYNIEKSQTIIQKIKKQQDNEQKWLLQILQKWQSQLGRVNKEIMTSKKQMEQKNECIMQ